MAEIGILNEGTFRWYLQHESRHWLTRISIYGKFFSIPALELGQLMWDARAHLEALVIHKSKITGNFSLFTDALSSCANLTEIYLTLENTRLTQDDLTELGWALAKLPKLEKLFFAGHCSTYFLRAAMPFLQTGSLRDLGIQSYQPHRQPDEEVVLRFTRACKKSSRNLQEFRTLGIDFGQAAMGVLAAWISDESSALERLDICCKDDSGFPTFLDSLRHNKSLKQIKLYCSRKPELKQTHVEQATTLQSVLLRDNFSLQEASIDPWKPISFDIIELRGYEQMPENFEQKRNEIEFLLFLNRHGRGNLLAPDAKPTLQEWIEKIAEHSTKCSWLRPCKATEMNDFSAVFYYLRQRSFWYTLAQRDQIDRVQNCFCGRNDKEEELGNDISTLLATATTAVDSIREILEVEPDALSAEQRLVLSSLKRAWATLER